MSQGIIIDDSYPETLTAQIRPAPDYMGFTVRIYRPGGPVSLTNGEQPEGLLFETWREAEEFATTAIRQLASIHVVQEVLSSATYVYRLRGMDDD